MAGLGFASVDTDVSSVVNAVFDELECPFNDEFDHGGDRAAFVSVHGCTEGYVCSAHLARITGPFAEHFGLLAEVFGHVICACCGGQFATIDQWVKVYPL